MEEAPKMENDVKVERDVGGDAPQLAAEVAIKVEKKVRMNLAKEEEEEFTHFLGRKRLRRRERLSRKSHMMSKRLSRKSTRKMQ